MHMIVIFGGLKAKLEMYLCMRFYMYSYFTPSRDIKKRQLNLNLSQSAGRLSDTELSICYHVLTLR